MATDKRERQRANRERKKQLEEKAERQEQVRQYGFTAAIVAIAVIAGLGLLYLATRGGDDEATETDTAAEAGDAATETSTTTEPDVEVAQSAVEVPEPGGTIDGETECPPADGSAERITGFSQPPPMCIDPTGDYTAEIQTTAGAFTVTLDAESAPNTVNNFVVLARYHYYDGTPFHRIIPDFVIQGGDAVGPVLGQGNPGYLIDEEPPSPAEGEPAYEIGSFAMAKGPGPGATGAQFFVVTGDAGVNLPPEYSLFGTVREGLDVVTDIESIPTTADDYPTEPIYIESVTITES